MNDRAVASPLARAVAVGACLSLLLAPATAQRTPAPAADIVVNMQGIEIAAVAEQISRITGRTLILDPAVKGVVTVTSAEPLSPSGVWDLFLSVLRVHGFVAVNSGRVWRIVQQANAAREAGAATGSQAVVTRMIRLRNVSSEAAARVLKPLVAQFGAVEAISSPNAVVVTDYADNVRRIEGLARALDSGSGADVQSVRLQHGTAGDIAATLQDTLGEPNKANGFRAVADDRSNVLLIRGESHLIAEAMRLVRVLDQPGGATPVTRMFRLAHADSEAVTEVLRGLLGDPSGALTNPVARSLSRGRAATRPRLAGSAEGARADVPDGIDALPVTAETGVAASTNTLGASPERSEQSGGARGFTTPDLTIQPAPALNAIVVRGAPSAIASIEPLIADLDVRRPQVLIEAAIVEINSDDAEALGVQLGIGAAALRQQAGAATSFTNQGLPLSQILGTLGVPAAGRTMPDGLSGNFRVVDQFSVLVQALGQSTKANLLSTPSLTTLDNEEAEIVVGQNVPFRTGSFATDGNSLNPFTTIQREDVGITLRVLPRIHDGEVVQLQVAQEVSSLASATVAGAADLITNRRSIQTTVLADNGGTIVLGGLITDDRNSVRSKVPGLGDIPVLGQLFRNNREQQTKRTLFVFLRPTILRDRGDAARATEERYGRLRDAEAGIADQRSLLLQPPRARLTVDLPGIY